MRCFHGISFATASSTVFQFDVVFHWCSLLSCKLANSHVHFHVAGTLPEGGTTWGEVREEPLEHTETIARAIRPYFDQA